MSLKVIHFSKFDDIRGLCKIKHGCMEIKSRDINLQFPTVFVEKLVNSNMIISLVNHEKNIAKVINYLDNLTKSHFGMDRKFLKSLCNNKMSICVDRTSTYFDINKEFMDDISKIENKYVKIIVTPYQCWSNGCVCGLNWKLKQLFCLPADQVYNFKEEKPTTQTSLHSLVPTLPPPSLPSLLPPPPPPPPPPPSFKVHKLVIPKKTALVTSKKQQSAKPPSLSEILKMRTMLKPAQINEESKRHTEISLDDDTDEDPQSVFNIFKQRLLNVLS